MKIKVFFHEPPGHNTRQFNNYRMMLGAVNVQHPNTRAPSCDSVAGLHRVNTLPTPSFDSGSGSSSNKLVQMADQICRSVHWVYAARSWYQGGCRCDLCKPVERSPCKSQGSGGSCRTWETHVGAICS